MKFSTSQYKYILVNGQLYEICDRPITQADIDAIAKELGGRVDVLIGYCILSASPNETDAVYDVQLNRPRTPYNVRRLLNAC